MKDTLNGVQTWHMAVLHKAKRCDRYLAGKTFLTALCSSLCTEWVTHITSRMTRIQWGSISGEQGSVTELPVPQSPSVCSCYPKYASLVLITLSLSPSLPPFSLYAFHFSFSSRTTYDWYHNLKYQLKEFLQLRVWQAARCQQRQMSGTALLFLTEAHGTPTNLLEYENLCVNLLQVSADSFGKANRVLFN